MNDTKVKSSKENPSNLTKRRSLSSIQPISTDSKVLTRSMAATKRSDKDKVKDKNEKITKWLTQKDSNNSDLKYWKTLAKEREKALKAALEENYQLTAEEVYLRVKLEEVKHENELLEQENQPLAELATEAVRVRDLVQECIGGQELAEERIKALEETQREPTVD